MTPYSYHNAELLVDSKNSVGEGPLWDGFRREVLWVDALVGDVHRYTLKSAEHKTWHIGQSVACLALHHSGAIAMGLRDGFALLDAETGEHRLLAPVEIEKLSQRLNDGKCDALGRWWAGTMSDPPVPGSGSLYRLDPDGTVTRQLSGVTISNGIGWSPDYTTMYYIDTAAGVVDAFDFDLGNGSICNRRSLVTIPESTGGLDGLAVDESGCLWVAIWGAGEVRCFSPEGTHIASLHLPVSATSSCAFGGDDLSTLFVTTARFNEPEDRLAEEPLAGGIFFADVGVRGMPVALLAGHDA